MTMPPDYDSEVSAGFAEQAWSDCKGSCSICGRVATTVVFIGREGTREITECRCQKHLPTTATTPDFISNPLFQQGSQ